MKTKTSLNKLKKLIPTFKKGQTVKWESQASGRKTKKTGVIVEVVKANKWPSDSRYNRLYKPGFYRDHQSYIVNVNGKLYWPLVKYLKVVR